MMNSIAWTGDPMVTTEIWTRLPLGPIERANLVRSAAAAWDRVRALEIERNDAERDVAIAEREEARGVAVREITVKNTAVPLARKLGQALGAIRDLFFAGAAGQTADAALRSLSPEECQILGVTAAPRRPEASGKCSGLGPCDLHGLHPERVAPRRCDISVCAACGAPACAEFGIKVDGVARPLCADCGDVGGTRLGTPERVFAERALRNRIAARDRCGENGLRS